MTRLIVAFLIAPVSVGILLTPVALVLTSGSEALWALKLNAVIGYPIAVVLGVPVWFAFSRLGWFSLRAYLLAGFAFSLVVVGLLVLWPAYHAQLLSVQMMLSPARLAQMLILAAATTFSVAVFWFIARPDHQH
ncbi:MAG: hypothetical protein JKP96_00540 [Oceanicaulis sp.]|jgi:hypothetical protein|nr:hypothetical protein [Oceanicaulis sp.]